MSETCHVADHEYVGMARHGQILLHRNTPSPIHLDPRQHRDSLREGGCFDTGCPQDGAGGNLLDLLADTNTHLM